MSKGKWKPESVAKLRMRRAAIKPLSPAESISIPPPAVESPGAAPAPLPPFNSAGAAPGAQPMDGITPPPAVVEQSVMKSVLASQFCKQVPNAGAMLSRVAEKIGFEIEFTSPTPEEGAFWAEFAFPVWEMYFPQLEKDPKKLLIYMTIVIAGGNMKIKKKENKNHGTPGPSANGIEKPSGENLSAN